MQFIMDYSLEKTCTTLMGTAANITMYLIRDIQESSVKIWTYCSRTSPLVSLLPHTVADHNKTCCEGFQ